MSQSQPKPDESVIKTVTAPPSRQRIDFDEFRQLVEITTRLSDYPRASEIAANIPIYDGDNADQDMKGEWCRVVFEGPGVFVVRSAFRDHSAIDAASEIYKQIIAEERASKREAGDHFAAGGANDRVWNSLQKLCLRAPDVYVRYMANPAVDLACRAVLGPGYQLATQINQVRPGSKAQTPHRDYHLGFIGETQLDEYPQHVHQSTPYLILQGAVAHVDVSVESGSTQFLPHSQKYADGFRAIFRSEFREYFAKRCVQLPLKKGDAVFFSPALFHAAGANVTKDVTRLVNLLQIVSAFARHMECLDRTAMTKAIYPVLGIVEPSKREAVIAATAEGYPFPTNLDEDPPIDGLAPLTQQDLMRRALQESWTVDRFTVAIDGKQARRRA